MKETTNRFPFAPEGWQIATHMGVPCPAAHGDWLHGMRTS